MQSTDYLSNGKRARPSATHSSKVPLRTYLGHAPKDAPRMDTSFACISPRKTISGVLEEPLLRINAKSQAVTGEPGRAGSSPIASAATTPQPAGRSIANSAAIWRRGINVRLFECSDCSIGRSGARYLLVALAGRWLQEVLLQVLDAEEELLLRVRDTTLGLKLQAERRIRRAFCFAKTVSAGALSL